MEESGHFLLPARLREYARGLPCVLAHLAEVERRLPCHTSEMGQGGGAVASSPSLSTSLCAMVFRQALVGQHFQPLALVTALMGVRNGAEGVL